LAHQVSKADVLCGPITYPQDRIVGIGDRTARNVHSLRISAAPMRNGPEWDVVNRFSNRLSRRL